MEEGEGLKGKIALHPLPLNAEQGRGAGRRRWPSPAAQGMAAAGIRGKRERGPREIESPPNLGGGGLWRWRHGGGRRRLVAVLVAALRARGRDRRRRRA